MSDEQKNVDDGKRWQVDYDCNLVWEQTSKSNTNLNELKNYLDMQNVFMTYYHQVLKNLMVLIIR